MVPKLRKQHLLLSHKGVAVARGHRGEGTVQYNQCPVPCRVCRAALLVVEVSPTAYACRMLPPWSRVGGGGGFGALANPQLTPSPSSENFAPGKTMKVIEGAHIGGRFESHKLVFGPRNREREREERAMVTSH